MAQMYRFVDIEKVQNKRVAFGWWVIWILLAVLLTVFIFHPDWFIIPPNVHDIQVQL